MSYLVFFDLDDTLIKGQSQKLLIKFLFQSGKVNLILLVCIYFWFFLYNFNLIKDVIEVRKRAFLICKGWSVLDTDKLLKNFFDKFIIKSFYNDALSIIRGHKKNGGVLVLLSSSLFPLVKIVKDYLDFDFCIATKLEISKGSFTGKIDGSVVYGNSKVNEINKLIKENKFTLNGSYAYSDHYSDLGVFYLVDNPVVVNARINDSLFQLAKKNEWQLINFKS